MDREDSMFRGYGEFHLFPSAGNYHAKGNSKTPGERAKARCMIQANEVVIYGTINACYGR